MNCIKKNLIINSRGSIYAELITSFFVWMIIVLFIIPTLMHVIISRKELLIHNEANNLLTKQVVKIKNQEPTETMITGYYGTKYYTETANEEENIRICILYHVKKNQEERVCETVRQ